MKVHIITATVHELDAAERIANSWCSENSKTQTSIDVRVVPGTHVSNCMVLFVIKYN